jgi:hypothetical protein
MTTKKKPRKYVIEKWRIEEYEARLNEFAQQIKYLQETSCIPTLTIYSADSDICIGMNHRLWHRIVCKYDGNSCLGGPRAHVKSQWDIKEDGYHLRSFEIEDDERNCKGWRGQYLASNELKYDEIPRKLLNQHHQHLAEHLKKISIWYPCHIYNDFTGELYRP